MKKGFTLIELLAVIVILAIIALIATPIVLNIINDTKESAIARSADFYIDAVEYAISKRVLDGKTIEDGVYNIMSSGNICIGTYDVEKDTCTGDTLEVEADGERPNGDKITIKDGQIISHVIKYGDVIVNSKEEGEGDDGSDSGNNGSETPSVEKITFTIGGTEYQAEEGMTWGEWVKSQYNISVACDECGKYRKAIRIGSGDYVLWQTCESCDGATGRVYRTYIPFDEESGSDGEYLDVVYSTDLIINNQRYYDDY